MLSSDALIDIVRRYSLPESTVSGVEHTIDLLRPSDVLTKVGLARRVNLDTDFAEKLLFEMVNAGLLGIVIRVDCSNGDTPHSWFFYSLKDYARFVKESCPSFAIIFIFLWKALVHKALPLF